MNAIIRPASIEDIDAMTQLLRELFEIEEDFNFDQVKQAQGLALIVNSPNSRVFVAESDGLIIGMCTVQLLISTAEGGYVGLVEDMVVSHPYIGKGIGRKLLTELETWSKAKGLTRLQLLADVNNQPALVFYRKMGWSDTSLVGVRKLI